MRRIMRTVTPLIAIVLSLAMMGSSAHAVGTIEAVVTGSGTISPGLTLTPTNQSVTFTGTVQACGWDSQGGSTGCGTNISVSFSGNGTGETEAVGNGSGTVTVPSQTVAGLFAGLCGVNTTVTVSGGGGLTYARVGAVVVVNFNAGFVVNVSAGASVCASVTVAAGVGVFVFVPTTTNPVTAYALVGAAALVEVP